MAEPPQRAGARDPARRVHGRPGAGGRASPRQVGGRVRRADRGGARRSVGAPRASGRAVGVRAGRVHRLEPAALAGVMSRDVVMFSRYWKATTFSSVMQPVVYLLAFGLGFRALVPHVGHLTYVEYVATGVVATAILFASAFPGMFNTFVRWQFQRTYDAMLAAPVDVEELITAEVLWVSVRAGVYGLSPLIVGFFFGLEPEWGMLLVPLIGFVTGFGFCSFGVAIAAIAK